MRGAGWAGRSTADVDHGAGGLEEAWFADVVAGFFGKHDAKEESAQIVVAGALAQLADEVVFAVGEEAGANLAVGGEADPAACAAEGLCDGSDDADFARAVLEPVTAGGFADGIGSEWAKGEDFADARDDFCEWNDHLGGPEAAFFEGHELDEADDDVLLAGKVGEGLDLIVVEAAEKNAVDLDRAESGRLGGADAADDCFEAAGDAGDTFKSSPIDGVHADGDAVQAGGGEGGGEGFEEMAVGGDGDVELFAVGGAPDGEFADDFREIATEKRLAAGEADFLNTEGDEDANEAEVVFCGQLRVLRAHFAGAAVDALVVAAVGDGDAQVGDDAAVAVKETIGQADGRLEFGGLGDGGESGHPLLQAI